MLHATLETRITKHVISELNGREGQAHITEGFAAMSLLLSIVLY